MAYRRKWWEIEDPAEQEAAYREYEREKYSPNPMSDPRYMRIYNNIMAAGAMDLANSREAIQQALIAFGVVPEGFNDSLGSIDQRILDLINKNTSAGLSTKAILDETRTNSIKELINNLSARGLRRSGAKGAGLRKRQKDYDRAYSGALSKLLAQMRAVYAGYAQNQFARQNALFNAQDDYFGNWNPPPPDYGGYWDDWKWDTGGGRDPHDQNPSRPRQNPRRDGRPDWY